jgi:hypothetical protein
MLIVSLLSHPLDRFLRRRAAFRFAFQFAQSIYGDPSGGT